MSSQHEDDDDREEPRPRRRRRRDEDDDYDDDDRPLREPASLGDDAGVRLLLPVGRSGWAIASGYLGLISVLCLPGPLAVITGILAILDIKKNPKKHGMGRAIFGIVMGGLGTLGLLAWIVALLAGALK